MNEGNFEKGALRAQKYFFDNSIACFTANGSFPPKGRRFPETKAALILCPLMGHLPVETLRLQCVLTNG